MIHFELSADADNYCVIGDPVTHSKSPQIHSMFAEQCGQRLHYQAITLASSEFEEGVLAMQQQGMKGLNVTLPHKGRACSWVQERSQRAEYAAAVNTIWFDEKGIAHGDNTDGAGLVNDLLANRIELGGKRLLILGAGGAVRGILQPLFQAGLSSVIIANRTQARAQELKARFDELGSIEVRGYAELGGEDVDLIINGTSSSLEQEVPPVPADLVRDAHCYDLAYADADTAFVSWAREHGAQSARDGLGMLVRQAAESFFIWRQQRPEVEPVLSALRKN